MVNNELEFCCKKYLFKINNQPVIIGRFFLLQNFSCNLFDFMYSRSIFLCCKNVFDVIKLQKAICRTFKKDRINI